MIPEIYSAYVFIAVVAFIIGRRSMFTNPAYRLGYKIAEHLMAMKRQRPFVGEGDVKLRVVYDWRERGRNYRLIIEQDPQSSS